MYYYKRFVKKVKSKIIVKTLLYSPNQENLPLEKGISVSKIVVNKNEMRLLPDVSQFSIWLEKKKYFVQHKTNTKSKSLHSIIDSAGIKKNKTTAYPQTNKICYFSQIAECLKMIGAIDLTMGKSLGFTFLWDASPFHQDQFTGFSDEIFYSSVIRREEERNGLKRFSIDINGQVVFIEFTKENEFTNIFWIVQGITIQRLRG